MTGDGWEPRGAGGTERGLGGQYCHRPALGTHQLHSRQHLQEGDEVVAVSQIFIEVVDVLAHLRREPGEKRQSRSPTRISRGYSRIIIQ